jgi:hypothetical protein
MTAITEIGAHPCCQCSRTPGNLSFSSAVSTNLPVAASRFDRAVSGKHRATSLEENQQAISTPCQNATKTLLRCWLYRVKHRHLLRQKKEEGGHVKDRDKHHT